ncbi:glutathione S-transferase C-terminal-like protein [Coniophora puteana RWD-64-598 SS2]|uniref:Glutathione S-transferase C-terminal-like protein n=1 Tax=Coniophora puteana (strain RWD-64-598) TaxID=741705 RepID=R7SH70_CONPW|nr:glutathione S-transferase C-terminal-like protein [Coniophora puteana RWD-64-598 SS2]EIW74414.1 glutathione S-transferase C-terminal-like protein [Coniophora puteana RWD-64-598 SS2]
MAAAVQNITLYTAKVCPYAQRTELALKEAGANYKEYQIDLSNKPEWYAPKVNPASKVPAIAYGGPDVAPDQPSPDSTKLAESLILVEFVADLFPNATFLPKDPVERAKARFFIDQVGAKFSPGYVGFVLRGESHTATLEGARAIQALLPEGKKYAIGDEFTIADIAFAPFWARLKLALDHGLGKYQPGEEKVLLEALAAPEFAKFNAYTQRLLERPSFKATWDPEHVIGVYKARFSN